MSEYCEYHKLTNLLVLSPMFSSVLHLALISVERFAAMKYTFRYLTIFTGLRLKIAVVSTWVFPFFLPILGSLSINLGFISNVVTVIALLVNIFYDTFLSFIGLLCNPSSRETNQMWTDFTTSCCRIRKGEESSENYQDNNYGFACTSFPPVYVCIFLDPLF